MLKKLTLFALGLALGVMILGAYTRLTDAGLGCPDWPGCYGSLTVPSSQQALLQAERAYPESAVEHTKAWTEMIHRYFASSLGLVILCLFVLTFKNSRSTKQKRLATALLAMVLFQGALGMWTVTLKLFPLVVMAHLLGGLILVSLLWAMWHQQDNQTIKPTQTKHIPSTLLTLTLIAVFVQLALGGFTSANYASLSCPNFPACSQDFFPQWDFQAFDLFGPLSVENPIQYLSLEARQSIHMMHRLGAVLVTLLIVMLHVQIWKTKKVISWRKEYSILNGVMMLLLVLQIALGITNVLALLPLHVALTHHAIGIALWLVILRLNFILPKKAS